ncbi:hypothetical protein FNH13_07200 [Ornithinimicrobium ciconiae]|uniref:Uncharacterized protein n=1 Tax=Ornithinimicrobium ciconiae TaxID=2594265 RepID=A0A516G9I9_9MICO|nr:hypothetical protein [Ornithinimicrobium ciconiae]QDO88155.1 hypothetical protein FNH13_07200 [Ornithinimicrobium ciconiae]
MTTMTRTTQTIGTTPTIERVPAREGVGLIRLLRAMRAELAQDPERAGRRRVARQFAAYPATRGVGMTVPYRDAAR